MTTSGRTIGLRALSLSRWPDEATAVRPARPTFVKSKKRLDGAIDRGI
jgi:hypothetical protein